jgi:hypothetical protein
MSEPDDPRWLNEISGELREEVRVRPAWRARLLDDVAEARQPSVGDDFDDRLDDSDLSTSEAPRRRRIVLSPITGIAAALLFTALGAGIMYATLSRAGNGAAADGMTIASRSGPQSVATALVSTTPASGDRENVRFELSAPKAAHVTLVGSFNQWNPTATPLVRDPASGKWIVSLRLPPGRHVYAFVVDGDVTADPAAPRAADDDFGSANSVVLVSGRAS